MMPQDFDYEEAYAHVTHVCRDVFDGIEDMPEVKEAVLRFAQAKQKTLAAVVANTLPEACPSPSYNEALDLMAQAISQALKGKGMSARTADGFAQRSTVGIDYALDEAFEFQAARKREPRLLDKDELTELCAHLQRHIQEKSLPMSVEVQNSHPGRVKLTVPPGSLVSKVLAIKAEAALYVKEHFQQELSNEQFISGQQTGPRRRPESQRSGNDSGSQYSR